MIKYPTILNADGADVQKPMMGENQVKNNAGGYVYEISPLEQVKRFCIIGSEGGTYYVDEVTLTEENAKNTVDLIKSGKGREVFDIAFEVIKKGLSNKVDHSLFVLALCVKYGDKNVRSLVYSNLNEICNIATHLFMFVSYVKSMRGIGRGLKNAISRWYLSKDNNRVMQQVLKYQNRCGLTHKNLILCSHPKTNDRYFNELFKYILDISNVSKEYNKEIMTNLLYSNHYFEADYYPFVKNLSKFDGTKDIIEAIKVLHLTRENIPTHFLNDVDVWKALIEKMPYIALVRNLSKISALGILDDFSPEVNKIVSKLTNKEAIKACKIHPIQLFFAIETYSRGCGFKGSLYWNVNRKVVEVLKEALEYSFDNLEKSNKNICFAIDVSSSMNSPLPNSNITANNVARMLGYIYSKTNDNVKYLEFDRDCRQPVIKGTSYSDFVSSFSNRGGCTNLSSALIRTLEYIEEGYNIDGIVIVTDNETWCGSHPIETLRNIRKINSNFKMITLSTTATKFSSVPTNNDRNILDVVGFSADCISVVNQFLNGGL